MEQLLRVNREIEEELTQKVARGELDPITKEPLLIQENNNQVSSISHGEVYFLTLMLLISLTPTLGLDRSSHHNQQSNHPLLCSRFSVGSHVQMSQELANHNTEPATPSQPTKGISTPRSVPAASSSKPPQLIKRRSSVSGDAEDKPCKKPRVLAEVMVSTSQPSCTEVSKYFQTVNPRGSKIRTPEKGPQLQPQTLLQKGFGKENIPPRPNAATPLDPKLNDKGIISPVVEHEKLGDEAAEKLVAQGWRNRYSLKPQATATRLASLMNKANPAPVSVMRTPLQRIGANAMRGASRPTPGKTLTGVRGSKKSSQTLSIPKFAKGSSRTGTVVEDCGPEDERDATEKVQHGVFLEKFLYTPS